jgi:hypothetical protein
MRDVEIEREGTGWDTDYSVEWVDESDVPLTKDEIKMVDESEIDLERYAYIPDFDDFFELPDRDGTDDDDDDSGKRSVRRGSAFGAKSTRSSRASRNGDNDDDDDDDDDRPPRRRSSTRKVKPKGGLADIKARKATSGKSSEKPAIRRRRSR